MGAEIWGRHMSSASLRSIGLALAVVSVALLAAEFALGSMKPLWVAVVVLSTGYTVGSSALVLVAPRRPKDQLPNRLLGKWLYGANVCFFATFAATFLGAAKGLPPLLGALSFIGLAVAGLSGALVWLTQTRLEGKLRKA